MTHTECQKASVELSIETEKVGSVLNQEQRESGHLNASYAILNYDISLWSLTSMNHLKVYLISVSGKPSGFIDSLNQAMLQCL